jgi:DMSO/TMAO reductase YedYZ heme-binding membrane subunit
MCLDGAFMHLIKSFWGYTIRVSNLMCSACFFSVFLVVGKLAALSFATSFFRVRKTLTLWPLNIILLHELSHDSLFPKLARSMILGLDNPNPSTFFFISSLFL